MDFDMGSRVELVLSAALATRSQVRSLCDEARQEKYRGIVVPSGAILLAQHFLEDDDIKISCRIGCLTGGMDPDAKRYEAELAVDAGAQEIEIVPSLARLQDRDYPAVLREMRDIVESVDERPLKVAIEPMLWSESELKEIVQLVLDSGAQYLCTSGENDENVQLEVQQLRAICGPDFGIVARTNSLQEATAIMAAGANLVSLRP